MLFACFHVVSCRGLLHVRIHTAALYYVHTSPCVLGDTLLNPAHTHRSVVRFSFVVDCFVKLIHLAHTQSAYCSSMKSYLNYAMRFQMRMNGSHGCDGKSAYHQWMLISSLVAQCVATMNVVHLFLSLSLILSTATLGSTNWSKFNDFETACPLYSVWESKNQIFSVPNTHRVAHILWSVNG